jgi:hypothetical protein
MGTAALTAAAYAWLAGATLTLVTALAVGQWIGDRLDPPDRHDGEA